MKKILNSKVYSIYPSDIYQLERHMSYPFERFAFNSAEIAIRAFDTKKNDKSIVVDTTDDSKIDLNFGISELTSSTGYKIATSVYSPILLSAFCMYFGSQFNDNELLSKYIKNPNEFEEYIKVFGNTVANIILNSKNKSLSNWIEDIYNSFNIDLFTYFKSVSDSYDICSKFIANHEIAHAYVNQFIHLSSLTEKQFKAFEYVADLLSVEWLYNKFVRNTPDSEDYKKFRGFETYEECILSNIYMVEENLQLMLLFIGISSALSSDGRFSLEGGSSHPNYLSRNIMQRAHFETLVLSNFATIVNDVEAEKIFERASLYTALYAKTSLFTAKDLEYLSSIKSDFQEIGEVVRKYGVTDLDKIIPFIENLK